MAEHKTKLRERAGGRLVDAIPHDRLLLDELFNAEAKWCVDRVQVLRALAHAGVKADSPEWPESVHWSWAWKGASCRATRLEEGGDARLFGIAAGGEWQALMFAVWEGHGALLKEGARPVIYVDYLESAPWNWPIKSINQSGRYGGAGTQLMELAVRWSYSMGYGGRVGLHALPQAATFYESQCGMANLGRDVSYNHLALLCRKPKPPSPRA
jgi:hypothetical protein